MAALGLSSCSNDEDYGSGSQSGAVPVKLTSNIISATATRAATNLNEGNLTTGGVSVRTSSDYTKAYAYTAGAEGALSSDAPAYYPAGGDNIDIVAYSPANANEAVSETFTVSNDQTTDAGYIASDLLWAKATDKNSTSGTVAVAFGHKMVKMIVSATAGAGVSTIQSITLKNIKRQCTFNYTTGEVSEVAAVSEATDIAVTTGGESNNSTGAACIPEQSLEGDFMEIVTDQGTATYTLSEAKPVAAGNYYTINVTVNKAAVGATNIISAWSDQGSVYILPTGSGWSVTVSGTHTYTGSAITPAASDIVVKDASGNTIPSSGYDVLCENNVNAGTARIIVNGVGAYAGYTATNDFTIEKAEGAATLSASSVTLGRGVNSQSVTVSGNTGTVSAEVTSGSGCNVSVSGTTITVTKTEVSRDFSATVTVTIVESANYKSTTKTVSVTGISNIESATMGAYKCAKVYTSAANGYYIVCTDHSSSCDWSTAYDYSKMANVLTFKCGSKAEWEAIMSACGGTGYNCINSKCSGVTGWSNMYGWYWTSTESNHYLYADYAWHFNGTEWTTDGKPFFNRARLIAAF